ncbi:DNA-binding MurR/RpiR family transcriptional regulator [Rhodoligotrophos appendicifer]|uniref:MurR/RpiR family transcriptional regulator n=1 Tax=Rhodoligotrophos appendicifer TaxID=987056 RepID=UPI00118475A2|nr:MurR/RpiR family transcriptional regulator [Rhodoligotrophos appendicifer]
MNRESLQELIEQSYPSLTPQIRRAAKYVLSAPTEIALYPMRTIAQSAKVSPSALVRLATQLGFDSYNDFRDLFRQEISRAPGPGRYAADAEQLVASRGEDPLTEKARSAITTMLASTAEQFGPDLIGKIEKAAQCILDAKTVYLIAFRNNHAAAFFFFYVARLLRKGIILVEGSHGMLIDELSAIEPGDCALVMSYEPYALDAVKASMFAKEAGAKVIALTDSTLSPVASGAEHVLVTPRVSVSFYQSSIPTMAVLETLIYFLVAGGGTEAVQRVSKEFQQLAAQGAYWDEGPNRL